MQPGSYDGFVERGADKWEIIRLGDAKTVSVNAHKICLSREGNSSLTMLGGSTSHATQFKVFFGVKRTREDGVVLYNRQRRQNHVVWFGLANDPFHVAWTVFMKCWMAGNIWTVLNICHLGISDAHSGVHSLLADLGSETGTMNPVTKPKRVKFSHAYSYSETTDTYNHTRISRVQSKGECVDSNTPIQQMTVTWTDFHPQLRRVHNWLSEMSSGNRMTMHPKHTRLHMIEDVAEKTNGTEGKVVVVIHNLAHPKNFGKHVKLFHVSETLDLPQASNPSDGPISVYLLPTETFTLEVTCKVMEFLENCSKNGCVEATHAYMCRHNNPEEGQRGAPFLDYMNTGGAKNIILDQHPTPVCYAELSVMLTMYSWDIAKHLLDRLQKDNVLVLLPVNASNDVDISTQVGGALTSSYPKQFKEIVYWIKKRERLANVSPAVLHCGETPRAIMGQTSCHVKTMRHMAPRSRSYVLVLEQQHLYVHTHLWWVIDAIKWSKGNAKIFVVYTRTSNLERPHICTRRSYNIGTGTISHRN
jgi:hypothetical protein